MNTYNPLGSPLVDPDGQAKNSASTPREESEFERFQSLARKVTSVPKSELEDAREG